MGNTTGYTSQVELVEAKVAIQIDPQTNVPGSENPQTKSVAVKAKSDNKGALFVGFSKLEVESEAKVSGAGFELAAGETITVDIETLGRMWFNGANAKDKLCILGVGP